METVSSSNLTSFRMKTTECNLSRQGNQCFKYVSNPLTSQEYLWMFFSACSRWLQWQKDTALSTLLHAAGGCQELSVGTAGLCCNLGSPAVLGQRAPAPAFNPAIPSITHPWEYTQKLQMRSFPRVCLGIWGPWHWEELKSYTLWMVFKGKVELFLYYISRLLISNWWIINSSTICLSLLLDTALIHILLSYLPPKKLWEW